RSTNAMGGGIGESRRRRTRIEKGWSILSTWMGEQFTVVVGLAIGRAVTFRTTQDGFGASPRPRIGNHL
ncbi:unnamed protein product, partial [Mycena citricolor]